MTMRRRWMLGMSLAVICSFVLADSVSGAKHEQGFVRLFNGKDLSGWKGDKNLWSVKNGAIHGESTKEHPAKGNTFCIWEGGKLKNFVLKMKVRCFNGNSGIQYRSEELKNYRVIGYQAEVDNQLGDVGEIYDEGGRAHLARVGQFSIMDEDGKKNIVSRVADKEKLVQKGYWKPKEWNDYTIIARGNHLAQYVNGYQTIEVIDNDPEARDLEGVLALQIHGGPPMAVEFKDIRLKRVHAEYGHAYRLFNGKNTDGWTFSSDKLEDTWSVKDGVLHNEGRPRGYIRTKDKFTNFVLRLQFRHLSKGNGGVLVRMHGEDKVWPKSIEAQGMINNVADIFNIGSFPMKTDPDRTRGRRTVKMHKSNERPMGEWNNYEIVMNGGELEIYVNRLLQNDATECAEIPGHICLQSEGAKMEFRNIVLIPIKKKEEKK